MTESEFFLEQEMFFMQSCRGNQTYVLGSIDFFFENLSVYDIMLEIMIDLARSQMTI